MPYRPLAGVLALFALALCVAADTSPPRELAQPGRAAAYPYLDDGDGRRIARLSLVAPSDPDAAPLKLVVSATGAEVEPIAGYEGIAGANRFTAEQLKRLLDGTRPLTIRTRDLASGATTPSRVYAGRSGRVPQRRQRADGTIDHLATNPGGDLPLELHVEAGPLAVGRHEVEVLVGGDPRLRLALRRTADGIHVEAVESLGVHAAPGPRVEQATAGLPPRVLFAQAVGGLFEEQAKPQLPPAPPPVNDAEWSKHDADGKWVLYARDIAKRPDAGLQWVRFLVDRKEYELMEWIALAEPGAYGNWLIGRSLAEANAPQWVRDAMWLRVGVFGHGDLEAQALLERSPAVVLGWLRKHPDAAPDMLKQLETDGIKPAEPAGLLPPLTPEHVFARLDAPAELEEFGDGLKADPQKVYVHQVIRAIKAYIIGGKRGGPWEGKLKALTRHANPVVRREAYLAHTHKRFPALPTDQMLKVIDDPAEPSDVREAAALALSYGDHPLVYLKLHALAKDPRHLAWSAAVSRLGDVGDGFTEGHLDRLANLTPDQAKLVRDSADRIAGRVAQVEQAVARSDQGGVDNARAVVAERLQRAAWADLRRDPLGASLVPWTLDTTRAEAKSSDAVRLAVEAIAAGGTNTRNDPVGKDQAALESKVKQLAAEILNNRAVGTKP